MPFAIVLTGEAFVPGFASSPIFPETHVPGPLHASSATPSPLLSIPSPQISLPPALLSASLSSQSPSHVVTPSPSLSTQSSVPGVDPHAAAKHSTRLVHLVMAPSEPGNQQAVIREPRHAKPRLC